MNKPIFNKLNFDESALSWKVEGVTRNTIQLSWERREGVVEYSLLASGENQGEVIYRGPNTTFTHESLKSNTQYIYMLSGTSAEGKRTKPILATGRTAVRGIPVAPTFFESYGQTSTEVSFFWNAGVVEGGRIGYEIRRDGGLLETPESPPYTDTNPQQGRDHVYCIRTFDDEFYFSEPHCITVSFPDFTAPTDPLNLRTSNLGLILSWEESYDSSGDIIYEIDQGIGTQLGTTKEMEFAVTGLQPGQRYEFGVTAVDKAGNRSERMPTQFPAVGISRQRK
jgi:fibronectin type 3 domain-containing protein